MPTVSEIIDQMKAKFNADAASGLDVVFQFDIEDGDTYNVTVKDGTCDVASGAHDAPSVTLIMSSETLIGIMTGETDGMQAFMSGQLRAEGDIMLATKLADLFPVS
ncbi:SCP2 sterol-binding domain-containing protein [Aestuariirhabdus sp. LZHN29]|uniref:SCP2 sterol-binding domain-containing protein n=1 Tax=Aestuariirhabdus sp. LZHN29 TaxID=3417462 RepID=UPI003CEF5F06